jgi:dTDP-4-dehydrorhamnose reductase
MRILILGGDGMLGHQLLKQWSGRHEVRATVRNDLKDYRQYGLFTGANTCPFVDVRSTERLLDVLGEFRPEALINAVGIVKQRPDARESIPSLEINSLLPHRLALLCRLAGTRLVHLSTDCVFSGRRGNYRDDDIPDPEDLYGRSKLLGEVGGPGCVTLRTSIIGRELSRKTGLVEWFLGQRGTVRGFTRAIYTGFTTIEMARIIETVLLEHPSLEGVVQVSSEPIDKCALLNLVKRYFRLDTEIVPYADFHCDRSLDSTPFRTRTGYQPPPWDAMIHELADDFQGEA